jgi:hypothetical protein
MKNIQVIDGADNCTYDVYAATDEEFAEIFLGESDIEFIEDFLSRAGEERVLLVTHELWKRPVDKKSVVGIHGTLFYQLEKKKIYYPTKRESEMIAAGVTRFKER